MQLDVTPYSSIPQNCYNQECWLYIINTARKAGIIVNEDHRLIVPCEPSIPSKMAAIEASLDGKRFVIDYGDLPYSKWKLRLQSQYDHVFRYHYTAADYNYPNLHSFPPTSFAIGVPKVGEYTPGNTILGKQHCHKTWEDCFRLRSLAKQLLLKNFDNVDLNPNDSQPDFGVKQRVA